jgi:hypothetical protein
LVNSTKEFVAVENRNEVVDFVESGGGKIEGKSEVQVVFFSFGKLMEYLVQLMCIFVMEQDIKSTEDSILDWEVWVSDEQANGLEETRT